MAAPTFVTSAASAWNTNGSPKTTPGITAQAGDLVVSLLADEQDNGTENYAWSSSTAATWTEHAESVGATTQDAFAQSARATLAGAWSGATVSAARSAGNTNLYGHVCSVWRGHGGVGNIGNSARITSAAPSYSFTTSAANSGILVIAVDWNAADGAGRSYTAINGTTPTELVYFRASANYTVYAFYVADAGAAGAKTIQINGLAANGRVLFHVVEVLGTSSGQSQAVPLASETDAAQALGRAKAKTTPLATSTDTAQALTRSKRKALPAAAAAETAQPLGRVKAKALPAAVETDTARPVARSGQALTIAAETDTAQQLGRGKAKALPVAVEASTAVALSKSKSRSLAPAVETATAQPMSKAKSKSLAPAVETDAALAPSRVKRTPVPIATEADDARPINRAGIVARATETDAAVPLVRIKARPLPVAVETTAARPLARAKDRLLATAVETDAAVLLGRASTRALATATETSTALLLLRLKIRSLSPATEVDAALTIPVPPAFNPRDVTVISIVEHTRTNATVAAPQRAVTITEEPQR